MSPRLESGEAVAGGKMIRTGWFKMVRHSAVEEHHRMGWMIVDDLGPTHGRWSVLMWRCNCGTES